MPVLNLSKNPGPPTCPTCPCPFPTPEGAISQGYSIIDNVQLSHEHFATDYAVPGAPAICKTCGAMPDDSGMLPALAIQRIHRYKDIDLRGSFGPGVFSNYDIRLTLESEHGSAEFWDPAERYAFDLNDPDENGVEDGIYINDAHSAIKDLRFYDAANALTSDESAARTAVLTTHDGLTYTFELFTVEPEPTVNYHGRLIEEADRNGNAITIAYADPVTSTDDALEYDRNRLFQIATVTDAYGLSASFNYTWANGGWVVQSITLPNETNLTYTYNENALVGLNGITYPDGATSTFSAALVDQAQVVSFDDAGAEGIHRRKSVYLSLINWSSTPGQLGINQASNRVRKVVNGAGEVSYFNWITSALNGTDKSTLVYEGGGENGTGSLMRYSTHDGVPDKLERAKTWTLGQPQSSFTWELIQDYTAGAVNARVTQQVDSLGRKSTYALDLTTGAVLGVQRVLPGGALYAQESTTYNQFRQPLVRTDRLGRVTAFTYDPTGNLQARTVAQGTPAEATWTNLYNLHGQITDAEDANGNVTKYHYSNSGFLTSIDDPPDGPGPTFGTRSFSYDDQGRLQATTDAMGRVTSFDYDARNRVHLITYSDQSTEVFTYGTGQGAANDVNLLVAFKDRTGKVTAYEYDNAGRRTRSALQIPIAGGVTVEDDVHTWSYLVGTDLPSESTENGERTTYGYDRRKRLVTSTRFPKAATPLTTTFHYDANNRMDYEMDPYGRKTYQVFDVEDRIIRTVRETVPGGVSVPANVATLARNLNANAAYLIEDITYDVEGQVLSKLDGRGIATTFAYDGQGRMIQQIEAAGTPLAATTEYDYDPQGNRIQVRHPRHFTELGGFRSEYTYTGRNLLASMTEAAGRDEEATESYTYDLSGRRVGRVDARGATWTTLWSECCGYKIGEVDPTGAGRIRNHDALDHTTHEYTVPNVAQLSDFLDPLNPLNEVTTRYDARYRPIARTVWLVEIGAVEEDDPPIAGDPGFPAGNGLTTRWAYDDDLTDGVGLDLAYAAALSTIGFGAGSDGMAVEETNPAGEKHVTIYDGLGRVIRSIDGVGNQTSRTYDTLVSGAPEAPGNLVEMTSLDGLGHVTRARVDGAGRTVKVLDALGKATVATYDAAGNQLSARDPNSIGYNVVYDARNRETNRTDTAGDSTARGYDASGNVVAAIDGLGKATLSAFDGRNQKVASTDRIGGVTTFEYDENGNLGKIVDAQGSVTTYTYDSRNLLVAESFPPGQQTGASGGPNTDVRSYTYDAGRRLAGRTDQAGVSTTYMYDRANRLVTRAYPDGLDDTFSYDPAGRLTGADSARYDVQVDRIYDLAGRLLSETQTIDGTPYVVSHVYDASNRVVQVTYPNGSVVQRGYTDRDQLSSVKLDGQSVAQRLYDNGGRLTTTTLGNGLVEARTYKAGDRLVQTIKVPGVTNFGYTYDANKRKKTETDGILPANGQSFGYDAEDRLTSWARTDGVTSLDTQSWDLTTVGDWASTTRNGVVESRDHTPVHEVSEVGGTPLSYDARGNLTVDEVGQSYTWDVENRLASADVPMTATEVAKIASYRYDAFGRRVEKTVNGQATRFIHDGAQVVVEYDLPAVGQRAYVYGSYVDEPVLFANGGAKYYFHANRLYSISAMTNAAGSVVEMYRYEGYGRQTVLNAMGATTIGQQVGFTGRYHDQETGLFSFRHRMYSPSLGRFASRDLVEYLDGFSLYSAYFVPNRLDPSGLTPFTDCVERLTKKFVAEGPTKGRREDASDKAVENCLGFADDNELNFQEKIDRENGDLNGPAIKERLSREEKKKEKEKNDKIICDLEKVLKDVMPRSPSPEDAAPGGSDAPVSPIKVPSGTPWVGAWLEDTFKKVGTTIVPTPPLAGEAMDLLEPEMLQGLFFDIPNYINHRNAHISPDLDKPPGPMVQPPRWAKPPAPAVSPHTPAPGSVKTPP